MHVETRPDSIDNNSEHVPCGFSELKNYMRVSIPTQQRPPYWATKYKFAIKPSQDTYETIYTNIFFTDPTTNETYFLLEGEFLSSLIIFPAAIPFIITILFTITHLFFKFKKGAAIIVVLFSITSGIMLTHLIIKMINGSAFH